MIYLEHLSAMESSPILKELCLISKGLSLIENKDPEESILKKQKDVAYNNLICDLLTLIPILFTSFFRNRHVAFTCFAVDFAALLEAYFWEQI